MATINRQKLLSKEKLEAVFKMFDKVIQNQIQSLNYGCVG